MERVMQTSMLLVLKLKNASIDVYMDFNGDKDGEGFAAVQTRLYAPRIRLSVLSRFRG
ncbi:MAG: hypothetical protein ACLS9K_08750 [Lachnospira eligens]